MLATKEGQTDMPLFRVKDMRAPCACRVESANQHNTEMVAGCSSVGFMADEWEWLKARAAYHTEFDRRVRVFSVEETIQGVVAGIMADPRYGPPADVLRSVVAAAKKERAEKGETRWYD